MRRLSLPALARLAAGRTPGCAAQRRALAETLGLTLVLLALGLHFSPEDPFLQRLPFPWLWLGPLLLALRYGTLAAFVSSLLLMAGWQLLALWRHDDSAFPAGFFLGGLLLTLIAGEFADLWSTRLRRLEEARGYLGERLEALTRCHYLLRLSHERLEQQQLARPVTLQDALQQLRRGIVQAPPGAALPQAAEFLRLAGQACQLEIARLYASEGGRLQTAPVACLGEPAPLDLHDPLVQHALERRTLCHVQSEPQAAAGSRYLVAAPLIDSAGGLAGLLVVERLPFLSLHHETLRFLAVLGGYYADSLRLAPAARALLAELPDCPPAFAGELWRLYRIQQETGLASALLAVAMAPAAPQELIRELRRQARQLDVLWELHQQGRCVVLILLPLHGEAALSGCAQRLEQWLKQAGGHTALAEAGAALHGATLQEPPAVLLRRLLSRCGYVWA